MEYAVVFLPLVGAILSYFGKFFGNLFSQIFSSLLVSISAILSIIIFYNGYTNNIYGNYQIFEWISSGEFKANWSILIDPLFLDPKCIKCIEKISDIKKKIKKINEILLKSIIKFELLF